MNRDELLKRCVDRRVAHETSVVAVSHLFYVYLLSALKKGQRVEVPNFGTFGTKMVGVKRARRMPFFDVEKDLADKVNERYRDLKMQIVAKFEMTPVEGDVPYTGKDLPVEPNSDKFGKDVVIDTSRDLPFKRHPERFIERPIEKPAEPTGLPTHEIEVPLPRKERKLMPTMNLRDRDNEPEETPLRPEEVDGHDVHEPRLRDWDEPREGLSPILIFVIALFGLAAITFALNHFEVIHLWGERSVAVTEPFAEPDIPDVIPGEETPTPAEAKVEAVPTPTPTAPVEKRRAEVVPTPLPKVTPRPTERTTPTVASTGTGRYTLQVSSWLKMSRAENEVARLTKAGFDAYIQDAEVRGQTWHRVRVGRYATQSEANAAVSGLQPMYETKIWVATVGR